MGNVEAVDDQACRSVTTDNIMYSYSSVDDEMLAYLYPLDCLLDRNFSCDTSSELAEPDIQGDHGDQEAAHHSGECVMPLSCQTLLQNKLDSSAPTDEPLQTEFQRHSVQNVISHGEAATEQLWLDEKIQRLESSPERGICKTGKSGVSLPSLPYPATLSLPETDLSLTNNPHSEATLHSSAMNSCFSRMHQQDQQVLNVNLEEGISLGSLSPGRKVGANSAILSGGTLVCSDSQLSVGKRKSLHGCSRVPSELMETEFVKLDMGKKKATHSINTDNEGSEKPKQAVAGSTFGRAQEKHNSSSLQEIEKALQEPATAPFVLLSENIAEKSPREVTSGGKRKTVDSSDGPYLRDEGAENHASQEQKSVEKKKPKRNRTAEVHNLSERRRRDRINEKMKALQELIPNSNKTDKASMLDEAVEYLKQLQLQVQIMYMSGMNLVPLISPAGLPHLPVSELTNVPNMNVRARPGSGMGMDMAVVGITNSSSLQHAIPFPLSGSDRSVMMPHILCDLNKPSLTPKFLDHNKLDRNHQQIQVNFD